MGVTNNAVVRFPDHAQCRAIRANGRLVFVQTTSLFESLHVLHRGASYSPLLGPDSPGLPMINSLTCWSVITPAPPYRMINRQK